ncbi:hypothetical protein D7D52_03605 [Nocardia yunnanensis]|uniref:Uncharacterized protein n=2 Tax=Nocardia yunnanensis TaxID=2382165 RepID=A0A386Z7N7_9NOCA|nr:hypothetical protein D7D52_03605 [Nocardia yunnanensis]
MRELSALPEQIAEIARPYLGNGVIVELTTRHESPEPNRYRETLRGWRTPIRLLLIDIPDSAAADAAYDDWTHWIAGGGLLAVAGSRLRERASATGKFRDLATAPGLAVLQRIAACN